MSFFQELEGDAVVVVSGGVYKQVPLFTRDGYLYAKTAGVFVRLMADGSTSKAKTRIDFMSCSLQLAKDPFGRLCTNAARGAIALEGQTAEKLLGLPAPTKESE